jgi:phosphate transport system permease protein
VTAEPISVSGDLTGSRGRGDRLGDRLLLGLTSLAAIAVVATIAFVIYELIDGAAPAISLYGLGFIGHNVWVPNLGPGGLGIYGAAAFIYGTAIVSAIALCLGGPIGNAIGLCLSNLAPGRVAAAIGPLVELIAAIPSVVLGLWGILVFAPIMASTVEPALNSALGWIPIFGAPNPTGHGLFTAGVVVTIMVVPIIASISRELFQSVPNELKEGALALGATRWEMVRGVVLSSTRPGLIATLILGLSRALGEAIVVLQLAGGGSASIISGNLFNNGDSLASRIANTFIGALNGRETASLFYLAVILLVFGLGANLAAQMIVRRFELSHGAAR